MHHSFSFLIFPSFLFYSFSFLSFLFYLFYSFYFYLFLLRFIILILLFYLDANMRVLIKVHIHFSDILLVFLILFLFPFLVFFVLARLGSDGCLFGRGLRRLCLSLLYRNLLHLLFCPFPLSIHVISQSFQYFHAISSWLLSQLSSFYY